MLNKIGVTLFFYLHWFSAEMLSDFLHEVSKAIVEYSACPRLAEEVVKVWYELLLESLQHVVEVLLVDVVEAEVVVGLLQGVEAEGHYLIHQPIPVQVEVHVPTPCFSTQIMALYRKSTT